MILAPEFLTSNTETISLVLAAVILVMLSDFFNGNIIFPVADYIKKGTHGKMSKTRAHKKAPWVTKYASEGIAAAIFILYCYIGTSVLSYYIIEPILIRLEDVLLLVVIGLFFGISYLINTRSIRRSLMKV